MPYKLNAITGELDRVDPSNAASITTDTTNFDGWLSASDTDVQKSLDTLDDILKAGGVGTFLAGDTGLPKYTGPLTDGQLLIGSTGNDIATALPTGSDGIIITPGAGSLNISNDLATAQEVKEGTETAKIITPATLNAFSADSELTGFVSWTGSGNYFDDTTLGTFELLRGGTGYIKGKLITWAGSQSVTGITAGTVNYIYIDDTGTIGSTTTRSDDLYVDYIVLFQCFRDSTLPTNIQITGKENHPYAFPANVSEYLHKTVGSVIDFDGANITLNGTQKIQINGADILNDHGLETIIPDSGGVAETWYQTYTNASGKWALYALSDTFDGTYNNAGTATALGTNKYGIYRLYVGKDDLNTTTPRYAAVLDTSEYNNLAAANTAIANGTVAGITDNLVDMELAQLGYIIYSQSSSSIVSVIIEKTTLRSTVTQAGASEASLVTTNTTNFDGWLSAADTTVQASLETLDDILTAGGTGTVLAGTATTPTFTATPSVTSITISNAPTSATDGANKAYVDSLASGFDHKDTVLAASTANLTATYNNGASGVGATLTNSGTLAAFVLDGYSASANDRVLVKNQTTTYENGIYTVTTVGDGATAWVLTRATDYDTPAEMSNGSLVPVQDGTVNPNTTWMQNTNVTTIGTDAVSYQKFQSTPITTTQYAVQVGDVNDQIKSIAVGSANQVLTSNGAGADPSFQDPAGDVSASANLTDYAVVCGDGGAKGVQTIASVGTSGHVLTSNGAGALPTFQANESGLILIERQTVSSVANVDFTGLGGNYNTLILEISYMTTSTSSKIPVMYFSSNDGSSFITTGYASAVNTFGTTISTTTFTNSTSTTSILLTQAALSTSSGRTMAGTIRIAPVYALALTNWNGTLSQSIISGDGTAINYMYGSYKSSARINALRIALDDGTSTFNAQMSLFAVPV